MMNYLVGGLDRKNITPKLVLIKENPTIHWMMAQGYPYDSGTLHILAWVP